MSRVCPLCRTLTPTCPDCRRRGLSISTLTREQLIARIQASETGAALFSYALAALNAEAGAVPRNRYGNRAYHRMGD